LVRKDGVNIPNKMIEAKDFIKLKKQIDELLKKIEKEYLDKGENISSNKFNILLKEIKKRLVEKRGVNFKDYEELERLTNVRVDQIQEDNLIEFGQDMQSNLVSIRQETERKIQSLLEEINLNKKTKVTEAEVIAITKALIPEMPEIHPPTTAEVLAVHDDFDHVKILRDLNEFEKRQDILQSTVEKELGTNGNISSDTSMKIDKLKDDFNKQLKKINKDVESRFSAPLFKKGLNGKINKQVQEAILEPLRRLAIGLNDKIDAVSGTVGAQGPQGTQGFQGPQGTVGAQGTQGYQGTQGIIGTTGSQGTQGYHGPQGITPVGVTFYWHDVADGVIADYEKWRRTVPVGSEATVTATGKNTDGEMPLVAVYQWVSSSGSPGIQTIPAGEWYAHMYASVDNASEDSTLKFYLYKRNLAGAETELFNYTSDPINNTSVGLVSMIYVQASDISILDTDRLIIKVYAQTTRTADVTFTFYYDGVTHASHVHTPITEGAKGAQGFQGPQGTQGPQGSQGSQGFQGTQGTQGYQGTQGPQGDNSGGPQGEVGPQGSQGFQGPQGIIGTQGTQGFQGPQGIIGTQGTQGFQGPQGIIGTAGEKGDTGDTGAQGAQGYQGPQGTQGYQGLLGTQGTQGYQGTQGPQGEGIGGVQFASDHGTPATDEIINVAYGTAAAPAANTTTIGSLYITYTA